MDVSSVGIVDLQIIIICANNLKCLRLFHSTDYLKRVIVLNLASVCFLLFTTLGCCGRNGGSCIDAAYERDLIDLVGQQR